MAAAVKLLDQYDPGGLQRIWAKQMIIWVTSDHVGLPDDGTPVPWPIKEITLKEIVQTAAADNNYSMVVSNDALVKALETYVSSGVYTEGDLTAEVYVRPLWPSETHFGLAAWGVPEPGPVVPPGTKLSCTPADGVLPIPDRRPSP